MQKDLIFEDLDEVSSSETFIHSMCVNKFIAIEEFSAQKEYYRCSYLSLPYFSKFFEKYRNSGNVEDEARLIYFKIAGLSFILLGLIFFLE